MNIEFNNFEWGSNCSCDDVVIQMTVAQIKDVFRQGYTEGTFDLYNFIRDKMKERIKNEKTPYTIGKLLKDRNSHDDRYLYKGICARLFDRKKIYIFGHESIVKDRDRINEQMEKEWRKK